jgi:integrase
VEGHVEHRPNGRWYPILQLAPDPETGARRRTTPAGYSTRTEAREALRAALERARRGWQGPERVTLAEYLREWLPGIELSRAPTTTALYRTLLEHHVIPRIGGEKLQRLTPAALTKLYADLLREAGPAGRKLSPKSVRNVHTTLRKALADAVHARRLDWNPAEAAKLPKIDRGRDLDVWTPSQVAAFLAHVAEDRLSALYVLAATSGLRRSELLALRWSDLDLDSSPPRLNVRRSLVQYGSQTFEKEPKTARSRRAIALDTAAAVALKRHRLTQLEEKLAAGAIYADAGRVFADEIRARRPEAVSAGFRRQVKAAKLPPLTLHGLRHTFATLGLEAGIDTLYVSELLGHSSPAITMAVYQHTRRDRLETAVRQVGDAIFGR